MKFNLSDLTLHLLTAGAVSLLLSTAYMTSAVAETKAGDSKKMESTSTKGSDADFKKLDTNSDGKISLKEAVKDRSLANVFDVSDTDHDGMVSTEEYATYKSSQSGNSASQTGSGASTGSGSTSATGGTGSSSQTGTSTSPTGGSTSTTGGSSSTTGTSTRSNTSGTN